MIADFKIKKHKIFLGGNNLMKQKNWTAIATGLLVSAFLADATKSITDILISSWVNVGGAVFLQSSLFKNLLKNSVLALVGVFVTGKLTREREIFHGFLTGVLFMTLFRLVPSLVEVTLTLYYQPSFVKWEGWCKLF